MHSITTLRPQGHRFSPFPSPLRCNNHGRDSMRQTTQLIGPHRYFEEKYSAETQHFWGVVCGSRPCWAEVTSESGVPLSTSLTAAHSTSHIINVHGFWPDCVAAFARDETRLLSVGARMTRPTASSNAYTRFQERHTATSTLTAHRLSHSRNPQRDVDKPQDFDRCDCPQSRVDAQTNRWSSCVYLRVCFFYNLFSSSFLPVFFCFVFAIALLADAFFEARVAQP